MTFRSATTGFSSCGVLAVCGFAVLVALAIVYRVVFAHRLRVPGGRTRQPRLGLVDAFSLDGQRQLVLIRRDNVEHLVMIGGPNDVLVESQINRALTATAKPMLSGLTQPAPGAAARVRQSPRPRPGRSRFSPLPPSRRSPRARRRRGGPSFAGRAVAFGPAPRRLIPVAEADRAAAARSDRGPSRRRPPRRRRPLLHLRLRPARASASPRRRRPPKGAETLFPFHARPQPRPLPPRPSMPPPIAPPSPSAGRPNVARSARPGRRPISLLLCIRPRLRLRRNRPRRSRRNPSRSCTRPLRKRAAGAASAETAAKPEPNVGPPAVVKTNSRRRDRRRKPRSRRRALRNPRSRRRLRFSLSRRRRSTGSEPQA